MTGLATLAALLLAAVFAWSAVAKLRRPQQTARAFERLRVPLPGVTARLVPLAELGLVVALVLAPRAGAAIAVVLLVGFTLILLPAARASGHQPLGGAVPDHEPITCGCFGSASTAPISWVEIGRNCALIGTGLLAAIIAAPEPGTGVRSIGLPDFLAVGAGVLIVAVALQLLAMKRDIGTVWRVQLAGETTGGSAA